MQWCDIGVNLLSSQFDDDRADIIKQAQQQGVSRLILIGSDIAETRKNIEFCQQYSNCITTAGVHPHQAAQVQQGWIDELAVLANHAEVKAIGECGLDFNRDFSPRSQQLLVFSAQLQLAGRLNKPVYLHERDAFDTQLGILQEHNISHGVVHCFTGDTKQLRAYLELGLYIGITGWVCDERRGAVLQQAIQYIPDDRLLLETDAPYLLPRTITPKPANRRNEPAFLPEIAKQVARLKNTTEQQLAALTLENSLRLFNLNG